VRKWRVLSLRVFVGAPNKTPQQTLWATPHFLTNFLIIFFMFGFFVFACAKEPKTSGPRHTSKKGPDVMKPGEPVPSKKGEPLSPRREASQRIVHLGEGYLEKNEFDKAIQIFQEAINVDSENGIAYFYLAKALHKTQAYDDAYGLLERAQVLLVDDPEWSRQVADLKAVIEESKQAQPIAKPTGQEVYY